MSDAVIRQMLEARLLAMPSGLPTVWQNKTPPAGFNTAAAYQKAFLLRARNQPLGLSEKSAAHRGILQVTLCYPTGNGTGAAEAQAVAVQAHFPSGLVLVKNGARLRIRGRPSIGDPIETSPYTIPVSISYHSIF